MSEDQKKFEYPGIDKDAGVYRYLDEQGRKAATAIGSRAHIEHERAHEKAKAEKSAKAAAPVETSKTEPAKAPLRGSLGSAGEQSKS